MDCGNNQMTKFKQRIDKVLEKLITTAGVPKNEIHSIIVKNNELMEKSRVGNYLIKCNCNKWNRIENSQYLHWSYTNNGSNVWGKRVEAQWFSREEAVELITKYRGLRMVKRSVNGY